MIGAMEDFNVSLLDLSEVEREVFEENRANIRKLFLVRGNPSVNCEEKDEFRGVMRKFLESYISIFWKLPKQSFPRVDLNNNLRNNQNENVSQVVSYPSSSAVEKCLSKFRSVYRKYFRVVAYLTCDQLQTCHKEAVEEGLKKWSVLSSESWETSNLKNDMEQEGNWIREVNSWKREKILEKIKSEVLETITNEVALELPCLFGGYRGSQEYLYFYEKDEFAAKCGEIRKRAVQRFIEEITPLMREDRGRMKQVVKEFKWKDVKRKLICRLVFRNTLGKFRYYCELMKSVHNAVEEYGEKIDLFLYPESTQKQNVIEMNPNLILKEAVSLKQVVIPKSILLTERVKDLEKIDMKIRHLKRYHKEIHSKFGEVLRNAALIAEANLIRCEMETEEILGRMMGGLKDSFGEYKLSREHVDRWQERVEGELLMVIRKRKKFSIANQKHVERLLAESQQSTEEALQKINVEFAKSEFGTPISATVIVTADGVDMGINLRGRFCDLPMRLLRRSGAYSLVDFKSSSTFDWSTTCWKLATNLLPPAMESPTSSLISLLYVISPLRIFPGHSHSQVTELSKYFKKHQPNVLI